ncbi:hypothetical protein RQP46_009766 [Phenoliferia psychrophenolica]
MVAQSRETLQLDGIFPLPPAKRVIRSKLRGLPLNFELFGRERDLERTLRLLTEPNGQNSTQHVALVGLGGIGKMSLATRIAHDADAEVLGRPVFIRCDRLDTLKAFQTELLKLQETECTPDNEDLEREVLRSLGQERLFLILDNLLDSTDATAHGTYLDFIDSLSSIPSLTLLITSRNHVFTNRIAPRTIHVVQLGPLSARASEQLFRNEYARVDTERPLQQNEPDLPELISLLEGVPLAIVLVAAHARRAQSIADVIRRWKDGRAWDNGAQGRTSSLDFSLKLSFSDPAINTPDTLTLLRLLAKLPDPVLRRYLTHPEGIGRAVDAIIERSVGQVDGEKHSRALRISQPVREYILRHHSRLDTNTDIVRAVARHYFEDEVNKKVISGAGDALLKAKELCKSLGCIEIVGKWDGPIEVRYTRVGGRIYYVNHETKTTSWDYPGDRKSQVQATEGDEQRTDE